MESESVDKCAGAQRWSRSLSTSAVEHLVSRIPTWKVKTRTAKASVQEGQEETLESQESLKHYFDVRINGWM